MTILVKDHLASPPTRGEARAATARDVAGEEWCWSAETERAETPSVL
jgi:hypothetical protein